MLSHERLPNLALLLLAIAGAGISIYLTAVHYAGAPLVCTSSGLVNCERVLTSRYSTLLGIPVSVGGILWFTVTGILALACLLRRPEPELLQAAQVVWSLVGLGTVIYLVGVEVLALGVICAWCTALHVAIIASLLISVLRMPAENDSVPDAPAQRERVGRVRERRQR